MFPVSEFRPADDQLKILEGAKQMLTILIDRGKDEGSLSSQYVDDVAELLRILWRHH